MSKSRNRSFYDGEDVSAIRSWVWLELNSPSSEPHPTPSHHFTYYDSFQDWNNPIGHDGMRRISPCDHFKMRCQSTLVPNCTEILSGGHYAQSYSNLYPLITPDIISNLLNDSSPDGATISAFGLAALNKFSDQVPSIVSLINFIYELREMKDMIPKFATKIRHLPRALNNNFLSIEFAWKPFVGDLVKFTQLFSSVTARLDWLRKNRGKTVPLHYGKQNFWTNPVVGTHIGSKWSYGWSGSGGREDFTADLTMQINDIHASCKLYQRLDGLDDAWAFFRALTSAAGVNNPAKIVWAAIPFSFIVDWFFPVSDWLNRVAVQPFGGAWDLTDCCFSIQQKSQLSIYHEENFDTLYAQRSRVGVVYVDSYRRRLGLPISPLDLQGLDSHKQTLLASLLYSFLDHGKKIKRK